MYKTRSTPGSFLRFIDIRSFGDQYQRIALLWKLQREHTWRLGVAADGGLGGDRLADLDHAPHDATIAQAAARSLSRAAPSRHPSRE